MGGGVDRGAFGNRSQFATGCLLMRSQFVTASLQPLDCKFKSKRERMLVIFCRGGQGRVMIFSLFRAALLSAFLFLVPSVFAVELTLVGDWRVQVDEIKPRFLRNPEVVTQVLDVTPSLK